MQKMMENTSTHRIIQQRPFHLSYYEKDLEYNIYEVSLIRDCHVIQKVGSPPPTSDYFLATYGPDRAYVRIFQYLPTHEYRVMMTLTPWPSFAEDPFYSGSSPMVGDPSLRHALEMTHRIYFYYRHEAKCPIPYKEYYMDVQLSTDIIKEIEAVREAKANPQTSLV